MKIAILGFDRQGRSAYDYWNNEDNSLVICDRNPEVPVPTEAQTQLGPDYLKDLDLYDLLVRTPGLHPRDIKAVNAEYPNILDKVTTNTDEFMRTCPSRNIIGVTGTKGKGTTSTLIARILEAAGHKVHLGGNIGIAPLEMLKDDISAEDWVVLELANFQLIDIKHSPTVAVCLMVVPEHLDWHTDTAEYFAAKSELFKRQTTDDTAIYYALNETSESIASVSVGNKIPYMQEPGATVEDEVIAIDGQEICKTHELKLLGEHNWQNVCAAVTAAWQVTQDIVSIRRAVTGFSGLPFRIEFRKEHDGVRYVNDSFSTTPDSCIAAMNSIPGKKVMIIGGYDRGLDMTKLVEVVTSKQQEIRSILVVGASAQRLTDLFQKHNFTNYTMSSNGSMQEIVKEAADLAEPGDAVILSPAFASFDKYKNFEDRGMQFNEAIDLL